MDDEEGIDENRGHLPFSDEDVIKVIPLEDVLEGRENLDEIIAESNNFDDGRGDDQNESTSMCYDEDSVDEMNEDDAKITIQAHQKDVFCVDCFDDRWIATGGEDDSATLFDLAKNLNEPVLRICEHVDSVICVRFNASGKLLATGDMSGKIIITEVGESMRKRCEMDDPSELEWLEWHRSVDILLAGAKDGLIWMWLIGTDGVSQTKVFAGGAGACTVGRLLADGKRLLCGYADGTVRIWLLKDSTSISLNVSGASPTCIQLHCKLPIAVIGDEGGACTLINTDTAKVINVFNPQQTDTNEIQENAMDSEEADDASSQALTKSIECLQFCGNESNENWLAIGTNNGRLCIYDINLLRVRTVCDHEEGRTVVACRFYSIASIPFLLTASLDGVLRIWDARSGEPLTALCGGGNEIFDMALMAKSQMVITACASGNVRIFELPTKKD